MTQRTQKQLKALQNKLANITADIAILEKELNLAELLHEKENLAKEHSVYTVMISEERELKGKVDSCILKIKEYDTAKLDANFDKKQALHTENEIYTNEQARIEFAFSEWKTYMCEKLDNLTATRTEIEGILAELTAEKVDVDTTISNYTAIKRDLRMQNMNMILAQQLAYKQNKEQYKTHTCTVAGLLLEKAKFDMKVNTYTQERYNINNDYYMWKCECEAVDKVSDDILVAGEHHAFEKRAKLSRDSRQDYALRYMKLDADLVHSQNMIKRIDKQLARLDADKKERPILRLNKNTDEHLVLAEYHTAKQSCGSLQQQLDLQTCMLDSIQSEINSVSNSIKSGQRPVEITDFEQRAKQRIAIMTSRIEEKYNNTIADLDTKIQDSRNLMETYQKKYEIVISNKSKKDIHAVMTAIDSVESKLERQATLDRLLQDKAQILESIAQLPVALQIN
jgi:hypothetical protein